MLDYRTGGRQRRATIARCSEILLKAARERAGAELVRIREGGTDLLERRREQRKAPTVAEAAERFIGEFSRGRIERRRMSERTRHEYDKQLRRYVLPKIGRRRVKDIGRADIERLVERMPGPTRNRVLALCSRLFNVCEMWEYRPQHTNPVRGIERAVENARDRVLSSEELARLAEALDKAHAKHPAAVAAIRVAAVTGLRISEVLAIQWGNLDFETGRLQMQETKTGARVHDLPSAALAVLAGQPRISGNQWAFTNGRNSPVGYRHARNVFATAADAAGLEDCRLHDLRRTVMTQAAMAGVGTHVLRDLLGHKTSAMADRYVRAVGNPVREAREAVGARIAAMMEGLKDEVVPLRGRHG